MPPATHLYGTRTYLLTQLPIYRNYPSVWISVFPSICQIVLYLSISLSACRLISLPVCLPAHYSLTKRFETFLCVSISTYLPAYLSPYFLGFLPLEPSMGGIEECEGSTCHGALIKMAATEVSHARVM